MNRDVQLVIRAQDQASRTADAVTDALKDLRRATEDTASSADRSGSRLERFGAALGGLQRQVRASSVGERLDNDFDAAGRSIQRLERGLEQSQAEFARFGSEAVQATVAIERQRQASAALETQLARERAALAQLRRERRAANTVVARAGADASPDQVAALERAERAVQDQAAAVERLNTELRASNGTLREVTNQYNELSRSAERTGTAIQTQTRSLGQARLNFLRLAREAGRAEEAIERLGDSATRELRLAVGAQSRIVREAESNFRASQPGVAVAAQEFRAAQQAADAYARELGEGAATTRQARAEAQRLENVFNTQRQIAAQLRGEYRQQQVALGTLRNISRETANDTAELGARQARFVATLDQAQQASQRTGASIGQLQGRLTQLAAAGQRAGARTTQQAGAQNRLASAMGRANVAGTAQVGVLRRLFGEGRRALSITQRLRGQVLALATQYVGFFAVAQGFTSVIDNVQKLEGVTNGLAAVFQGDIAQVNDQLDFLRRNANRLGIGFTDLSTQYTRFAAATQNTPIEDSTEGIFLRVAEAGRVLNLSTEELNGTLTALSQIASIGTIQSEELRQQLGDRLPGAVQLLADGLNVTTEELFKLIDQGEISSQALNNFADQLEQRFGAGLAGSLVSLNAELARLGNTAQQAQLQFAEAGFSEALTEAARDVREVLESAEFQDLITNAAQVAAGAIRLLVDVFENFRVVIIAASVALAVRFVPLVIAARTQLVRLAVALALGGAFRTFAANTNTAAVATTRFAGASTVATGAVGRLGTALRFLVSSTGIGLLFVAASAAAALFATRTRESTAALSENRTAVDRLRDAYDEANGDADKFRETLEGIGRAGVIQNLNEIRDSIRQISSELTADQFTGDGLFPELSSFGADLTRANSQVAVLVANLAGGRISLEEFNRETDALVANFQGSERATATFAQRIGELQTKIVEGEDGAASLSDALTALVQAEARLALQNGATVESLSAVQREALGLGQVTSQLGDDFVVGTRRAQGLQAALEEISKGVPELAAELKKVEELKSLREILEVEGLPGTLDGIRARLAEVTALLLVTEDSSLFVQLAQEADTLDKVLGIVEARLKEINRPQRTRSERDPFGDAVERLNSALGRDQLTLSTDQLRAENRELEAVLTERRSFVEGLITDDLTADQAANLRRLGEEYIAFGQKVVDQGNIEKAREGLLSLQETVRQIQIEEAEALTPDDSIGRTDDFVAELNRSLEELRRAGAENGVDPTTVAALAAEYERAARAVFNIEEAQRMSNERIEEARAAEEQLNLLIDTRRSLIEQLTDARVAGDGAAIAQIQARITMLDASIGTAATNAKELYANIAGQGDISIEEAENAALRIETAVAGVSRAATQGGVSVGDLATIVGNNLNNAFSQFAESIANGENVLKSLGQAFRQFASETLIEIGRVIARALIMQAIFGALGFLGISPGAGVVGGISASVNHSGREGNTPSTRNRSVNPAAFAGAPRFHEGRVGLSSGEMAAIIRTDEDVLTRDNPFSSANLGKTVRDLTNSGGSAGPMSVKIVNVNDPAEALEMALSDNPGERVIMNFIRRNAPDISAALES